MENGDSTEDSTDSTIPRVLPAAETEIESPGRLTESQIRAIQNDYRNGFTPEQIILVTGIRRATVYKHLKNIEPPPPKAEKPAPDPPVSSLSQPAALSSAPPPRIIEVSSSDTAEEARSNPEPNGGYESTQYRPQPRPSLPVIDTQTVQELILLFGGDMRRLGFTSFVSFFEEYVIPNFQELDFWQAHVPGNTLLEKRTNLSRYLWLASKHLALQKEFAEYEAANNGSGLKEEA